MFFMVCAVLALGLLKSLPCIAQAEIAPDHFDTLTAEQAATADSLQGSFTLPYQVNYAGQTLPAGVYSLLVQRGGGSNLITMTAKGTSTSVQARVKCHSGLDHPTALILERSGEQRVLTAISFEQPGHLLQHLQLQGANSRPISADSERVLVSYTARTGSAK
jgi:hypothetical protein